MSIFRKNSAIDMLRALIIDDEAHQRQTIRKMTDQCCPNVLILGEAGSVASGVEAVRKYNPDLIFLDIKMDDGTGFDLLERLQPVDFKVIFITAWDKYAIKAFRFSALDYLLKPLDPDDLMHAVLKARDIVQQDFNVQLNTLKEHLQEQDKSKKKIIIRTADTIFLVNVNEIVFGHSDSNYTQIKLSDGKSILVSCTLKEYEELLSDYGFFRVHKSYLINMRYITSFEKAEGGTVILRGKERIPVASRKRDLLLDMFDQLADT